ncbi:MAG: hypothetical protein JKY93_03205 [Gammaproteobacteria bacterium]|nr:hypothetical protein [Gammaproteobacteria bacterium]
MIKRTLDDYINVAVIRNNFRSKREFCKSIGVSHNAINTYNNGTFPSDDTMLKIADLAGIDKEIALLELGIWKNSGAAQKAYASILQKMARVTAAIAIMLGSLLAPQSADAGTNAKHSSLHIIHNIHYHTHDLGIYCLMFLPYLR